MIDNYNCIFPNELIMNESNLCKSHPYIILVWEYIYTNTNRLGECKFLVSDMVEEFGYKSNPAKNKINDKFIECIQMLYKNNLIEKLVTVKDKKQYRCTPKTIDSDYFELKRTDRIRIFNNSGKDKVNIFRLYCYMLSLISRQVYNNNANIGTNSCMPSYSQIEREIGISSSVIKKYIDTLCIMNLITSTTSAVETNIMTRTSYRNVYTKQ